MTDSTIRQALIEAEKTLESISDPDPSRTSRILLSHVLGIDEVKMISEAGREISEEEWNRFVGLVNRRMKGEPLQYILGEWEFYGRKFHVSPSVYIPRPETEFIIDAVKKRYAADDELRIFDIGTGSGAISVTLAAEFPSSSLFACDINPDALRIARGNAIRLGVIGRTRFIASDALSGIRPEKQLDIIVSNPPYVPDGEYIGLQREITEWEPKTAFVGGGDGLDFVRMLLYGSIEGGITHLPLVDYLKKDGIFISEIGWKQKEGFVKIAADSGLRIVEIIKDYNGIPRIIVSERD
jgi:release factor glutamine methyltransferase